MDASAPPSSYLIALELFDQNYFANSICVLNGYCWGGHECDFMKVTKSLYMHEYEIKVSRSDFKADFKKGNPESYGYGLGIDEVTGKPRTVNKSKHHLIETGQSKLASFSFVVPEGLIEPSDVPDYAGLLYAVKRGNRLMFKDVKKPPRLKGSEKITTAKLAKLFKKTYYYYCDNMKNELTRIQEASQVNPFKKPVLRLCD